MALRCDLGELITAMITPFDENLKIDYSYLKIGNIKLLKLNFLMFIFKIW